MDLSLKILSSSILFWGAFFVFLIAYKVGNFIYRAFRNFVESERDKRKIRYFCRTAYGALECSKLAYPKPANRMGDKRWRTYFDEYNKFCRELGFLESETLKFLNEWVLEEKAGAELCRQETLDLLENIRDTVLEHDSLQNRFMRIAMSLDSDFKPPKLATEAKRAIAEARTSVLHYS